MACGTQVVPGYNEFNEKMKQHGGKDSALDAKINQLISKQFAKQESQVRNMPIAYGDSIATRKGDAVTEKMLKGLRAQQKAGVISASERRKKLDDEIKKNKRAFEISKDFSRKSFLDQLAS